jgi:hypothetical protein
MGEQSGVIVRNMVQITAELIAAYEATEYRVMANPPFTMRIKQCSAPLANLMVDHGLMSVA